MKLNHFDENGNAVMVDVSNKPDTHRTATAKFHSGKPGDHGRGKKRKCEKG